MVSMVLSRLSYFVAVAEERSVGRAADRLRMAQPPLSVQTRKLESSGGSSEKTLKKLNGAALTLPFSSSVVTSAIGLGTTTPHSNLYRSCGSSSRKEIPDI